MNYSEKLKDPRWQKKRLEVLERDSFTCQCCGDKEMELHVHHHKYSGDPWDTLLSDLITYCKVCHLIHEKIKKEYQGSFVLSVLKVPTWKLGLWSVSVLINYLRDDKNRLYGILFVLYDNEKLEFQMLCSFESLFNVLQKFSKDIMFNKEMMKNHTEKSFEQLLEENNKPWKPSETKDEGLEF